MAASAPSAPQSDGWHLCEVRNPLTEGAEQDFEAIHDYISEFDCVVNANYVLDQLMNVAQGVTRFPERGGCPKDLASLGIKEYRQTFFKPYRVVYRVAGSKVTIYLIADGRREMQSVLGAIQSDVDSYSLAPAGRG